MDPYSILGVKPSDSTEDICEAYRRLELRYNPNNVITGDQKKYEQIQKAYDLIQSPSFGSVRFEMGGSLPSFEQLERMAQQAMGDFPSFGDFLDAAERNSRQADVFSKTRTRVIVNGEVIYDNTKDD